MDQDDTSGRRMLIVHLVRDPRAVVHSQMQAFNHLQDQYRRFYSPGAETTEESAAAVVARERPPEPSMKGENTLHPTVLVESGQSWIGLPWYLRELADILLLFNIRPHLSRRRGSTLSLHIHVPTASRIFFYS